MHRQKTWEMIDRVSLDVARLNLGTVLEQRSSDEHLEAVQRALREKYPTNKNVNVSLETLQGYFDEFCPDCEERNHQDLLALQSETGVWPAFDVCLDSLKRQHVDLWETVATRFSIEEFAGVTQQAYMAKVSLSRTAFEGRMSQALQLLRDCVEKSVDFELRRR